MRPMADPERDSKDSVGGYRHLHPEVRLLSGALYAPVCIHRYLDGVRRDEAAVTTDKYSFLLESDVAAHTICTATRSCLASARRSAIASQLPNGCAMLPGPDQSGPVMLSSCC
jgi:hypothetical protein